MITEKINMKCNGKQIATVALVPETEKEKAKGMYKIPVEHGKAMLFFNHMGLPMLFDMLWMKERIGFIALNVKNEIVDIGIMKPWRSFKFYAKGITTFIETHPDTIQGLNKGDVVKW